MFQFSNGMTFYIMCNAVCNRTFIFLYTLPAMCIPLSTIGRLEILATDSKCGKSECRLLTFARAMENSRCN